MTNTLVSENVHEKIENITKGLFTKYNYSEITVEKYLDKIIKDNNLDFYEGELGELSGYLEMINGKWRITVNKSDSITRKIFTIAHELGHFFLHKDKEKKFIDGGYTQSFARSEATKWAEIELEANEFAGQLVMPYEKIKNFLEKEKGVVSELEVRNLADKFRVSPYAMSIRLRNLHYSV